MTEKACLKIQISDWNGWKIIQLNIKYRNTKVKNGTVRVTICAVQENTLLFLNGLVSNMNYSLKKKKFGVFFFFTLQRSISSRPQHSSLPPRNLAHTWKSPEQKTKETKYFALYKTKMTIPSPRESSDRKNTSDTNSTGCAHVTSGSMNYTYF